jgi:hypothetical protein
VISGKEKSGVSIVMTGCLLFTVGVPGECDGALRQSAWRSHAQHNALRHDKRAKPLVRRRRWMYSALLYGLRIGSCRRCTDWRLLSSLRAAELAAVAAAFTVKPAVCDAGEPNWSMTLTVTEKFPGPARV